VPKDPPAESMKAFDSASSGWEERSAVIIIIIHPETLKKGEEAHTIPGASSVAMANRRWTAVQWRPHLADRRLVGRWSADVQLLDDSPIDGGHCAVHCWILPFIYSSATSRVSGYGLCPVTTTGRDGRKAKKRRRNGWGVGDPTFVYCSRLRTTNRVAPAAVRPHRGYRINTRSVYR
jgi:hypothetical protein